MFVSDGVITNEFTYAHFRNVRKNLIEKRIVIILRKMEKNNVLYTVIHT